MRTAQEEHGVPSSFTLKSLLRPIHRLFSCSFPWKTLSQIKPSTPNCSISSAVAVPPLCPLCVAFNLSNVNSQLPLLHCATFSAPQPLSPIHHIFMHPLISHLSLSESCCLSFCLSLSVFWRLCYSPSLPPSLWAPGGSVGLSEEKCRFK